MRKFHLPWQRGTEVTEQSSAQETSMSPTPAGPYFKQNMPAAQTDPGSQNAYPSGAASGDFGYRPAAFSSGAQSPAYSGPVQPVSYPLQGQPQGFSAPVQPVNYPAQGQAQGFSGPVQPVNYPAQGQAQGFSGPVQPVNYPAQGQPQGFSGPVQPINYPAQGQPQGFSAPVQPVNYPPQGQAQGFSGPVQPVNYPPQGQPQGFSGPVQPVTYPPQGQPQGFSGPVQPVNYPPQGTGFSAPVTQPGMQGPAPDETGSDTDEPAAGAGKQLDSRFSFRPSFIMPQNVREKLTIAPIHIAIVVAVVLLAGWYLFNTYAPQAATSATIQAGKYGAYYTGEALIVRNEVPYDADGVTSIDYRATEGSFINNSTAICDVFSSGFSTREITALQDYRDQIRDYEQELLSAETTYDARLERVESEVLTQAKEVRSLLAGTRGNLINQESTLEAAITARQQYLRQKYSSDQRLSRLLDDEQAQQQRIDSWTKTFYGTRTSLVSFYTDGFEYGLTVQNCLDFTPSQVRSMINGQLPVSDSLPKSKTTIYRTIMDEPWYVLMLVDDTSWNPVEGASYALELNQFENTQVEATVISFTRSGGELLVRLRVENNVESVLYMRTGTARLGDNVSTMMVPARAIYRQNDMDGVVVIDGSNRFFVPVQIIFREGNNVYVNSLQQGLLFEGQNIMLF